MPIEKERLEALLNTAEHLEAILEQQSNAILQGAEILRKDPTNADALESIIFHSSTLRYQIMDDKMLIIRERTRWDLTHNKNDRDKRRREAERRAAGVLPRGVHELRQQRNQQTASTNSYLREMEKLGVSMEDAIRYAEEAASMADAPITADAPSTTSEAPPSQVHFEDSDEFALPEPDADETEVEGEGGGEGEGEGTGN